MAVRAAGRLPHHEHRAGAAAQQPHQRAGAPQRPPAPAHARVEHQQAGLRRGAQHAIGRAARLQRQRLHLQAVAARQMARTLHEPRLRIVEPGHRAIGGEQDAQLRAMDAGQQRSALQRMFGSRGEIGEGDDGVQTHVRDSLCFLAARVGKGGRRRRQRHRAVGACGGHARAARPVARGRSTAGEDARGGSARRAGGRRRAWRACRSGRVCGLPDALLAQRTRLRGRGAGQPGGTDAGDGSREAHGRHCAQQPCCRQGFPSEGCRLS